MVGVQMNRVGTLKDLGVSILVVALGCWLDGVDGIISWSIAALPPPEVVLPMPITFIVVAVTVVALIITTVVMTSIIAPVIEAVILLVRSRSLANVFLNLLVGLISICPLLRHREQVWTKSGLLRSSLVLRASWWRRPLMNAEIASSLLMLGMDFCVFEKQRM
jgi:hypothetical protein